MNCSYDDITIFYVSMQYLNGLQRYLWKCEIRYIFLSLKGEITQKNKSYSCKTLYINCSYDDITIF
jgi:hypothetical protein